jgi:hypothetical protein
MRTAAENLTSSVEMIDRLKNLSRSYDLEIPITESHNGRNRCSPYKPSLCRNGSRRCSRPAARPHPAEPSGRRRVEAVFVNPPEVYARGYRAHLNPLQALVFTHTRILHVSESEQAGTWIAAEDILKVKMSMVLLYGLLETWTFHGGELSKIQVEYNTVSQRFLSPLSKAILRQTWNKNPPQRAPAVEDPTFPQLLDTSYSFYNGLTCEALQPGEVVTRYVYQPELHTSRLKVGQRKVFPQTLCALTNRQIILLQQDLKYKKTPRVDLHIHTQVPDFSPGVRRGKWVE